VRARENSSPEISRPVEARGRKGAERGNGGADARGHAARERKEGESGRSGGRKAPTGGPEVAARERGVHAGWPGVAHVERKEERGARGEEGEVACGKRRWAQGRERESLGCWAGLLLSFPFPFFFLFFYKLFQINLNSNPTTQTSQRNARA
jgi:hypothetical protein